MVSWPFGACCRGSCLNCSQLQSRAHGGRRRSERDGENARVTPRGTDIAGEEEEEDAEERGEKVFFAYLVVNSDGEEDCYYSAPESPPVSEGDGKNISISYLAGV